MRTVKSDYARLISPAADDDDAPPPPADDDAAAAAAAADLCSRLSSMDEEDGITSALSSDMHDDCGWKQVSYPCVTFHICADAAS